VNHIPDLRSFLLSKKLMPVWLVLCVAVISSTSASGACGLASNNIPLDSPIYLYLDKLAGFGLIRSDMKGIRPFSKAEAARLVLEAEGNMSAVDPQSAEFAARIVSRLHALIPRELALHDKPEKAPRFDYILFSSGRFRYVYLDGVPRSYERPVHDPGGDGVFGIGGGLRPNNPYPFPVQQHGTEGTPLLENNEGIRYQRGNNIEFRTSSEAYAGSYASALIEPLILHSKSGGADVMLNKAYAKLGGGGLELEIGRDSNWLGIGYRTAITLSDNAKNFDIVKLSSPEPLDVPWLKKHVGEVKYSLIFSRFDRTSTDGQVRQPFFFGAKLSVKPIDSLELGLNLGRQQGGPGVSNSAGDWVRGLIGGTNNDNANSVAGLELRVRLPFLRNAEIYGEFSGEDTAVFWPIVESYVAGLYVPRLTADGRNDFRFEYYLGNAILSTSATFPEGYLYKGMNIGPSQGGASEEFFARLSHWFSVRNNLALECIHSERGNLGRVTVNSAGVFDPNGVKQAVERRNAARVIWRLPVYGDIDAHLLYGWERIHNVNLVGGANRTNQVFVVDLSYRY
jgi:hypothetical protein